MSMLKQSFIDAREMMQYFLNDSVDTDSVDTMNLRSGIHNMNRIIRRVERFEKTVYNIKSKIKSK